MPPEGDLLSAAEIATLTQWIDEGAAWPDGVDLEQPPDKRDHWSFKSLTIPSLPPTQDKAWARQDLDRFVLARLEQEGLRPAAEVDRMTWLRRVSFDLTGLPADAGASREVRERTRAATLTRLPWTSCWNRLVMANIGRSIGWTSCVTPTRMASRSTPNGQMRGRIVTT